MTDEIIAPLMPNSSTEQDEDEKYEISTSEDIRDNENENLLDNNRRENVDNDRIINREFNVHKKRGLIYLSYSFQTLLFFLSLYYLYDYIDNNSFIKLNLDVIFLISISIIGFIIYIHLDDPLILTRLPYILLIPMSLISTLSMFIILYKFSILLSFKMMENLMIICFAIYLYLFFLNFFIEVPNYLELIQLAISLIILSCFGFSIKIFENIQFGVISDMIISILILENISILHILFVPEHSYVNYPLIHINFHIDIVLMLLFYGLCDFTGK